MRASLEPLAGPEVAAIPLAVPAGRVRRWLKRAGPLAGVAFFGVAAWVLHDALRHHRLGEIVAALRMLPGSALTLALALTAATYVAATAYDYFALRYVARRLPLGAIALTAFVSYSCGNNVGNTLITGATIRYWMYSARGVPPGDIAKIVLYCSLGFWLGYLLLGALAFVGAPVDLPPPLGLSWLSTRPLGLGFVAVLVGYLAIVALRPELLRIRDWVLSLPSIPLTLAQLATSTVYLSLMGTTLWALLPAGVGQAQFMTVFMLALVVGTASQVPAGLGVFETVVIVLLTPALPLPGVVAGLIAFRGIFYVVPLALALPAAGAWQLRRTALRTAD
jgi:phosphatidylglycerol lysyltransferase